MRSLTTVALSTAEGTRTVTAETTSCPDLVINPSTGTFSDGDTLFSGGWSLTHVPTGFSIPTGVSSSLYDVRRFAESVAHLDWSFADSTYLKTEAGESLRTAVVDAMRANDEVKPNPDLDHDEGPTSLPRTADGAVPEAVRMAQHAWTRWFDGDEKVVKQDPLDGDGKANPLYVSLMLTALYAFDRAYLLASLQRLDSRAADSVSCWLADQHEMGDTVGEFLYDWTQQLERGEPLHLPGALGPVGDPSTIELAPAAD